MVTLSTTDARKQFANIIQKVSFNSEAVAIGRRDHAEVIIIPYPQELRPDVSEITNVNANSSSFGFLRDEPDLYSITDLKKCYA